MKFLLKILCRFGLHLYAGWKCESIAVRGGNSAMWFERRCRGCGKSEKRYF